MPQLSPLVNENTPSVSDNPPVNAAPCPTSEAALTDTPAIDASNTKTPVQTLKEPEPENTSADKDVNVQKEEDSTLQNPYYAEKTELKKELEKLRTLTPGADYAANEVVCLCSDKTAALSIGVQYGISLKDYADGLAVFTTAQSVLEIVETAADTGNDFQPVYPNYIFTASK